MEDDEILHLQRSLRARFFEGSTAIRWRPGRELAAQLLLYLDDPDACWRLTAEWLRETLDADRVDGGFGGFVGPHGHQRDYVVVAESQRSSLRLPAVMGRRFDAGNRALRAVWHEHALLAIDDVSQDAMPDDMRGILHSLGTAAKLAIPVRDGARPVGILCADWNREVPRWNADTCLEASRFTQAALGPLIGAVQRLSELAGKRPSCPTASLAAGWRATLTSTANGASADVPPAWRDLTPAELRVARLVAQGLSYKEVARHLDRSLSTVDHQLRSIRQKLGATSTARLVRLLSEGGEGGAPGP